MTNPLEDVKSPYFKFYVHDFLNGVKFFSAEEVGAYVLMLCEQWDTRFLEKDEKKLKKISRISEKKRKNVEKKFKVLDDGKLQNVRLESEKIQYISFINKQAGNGSKGGRRSKNDNPTLNPNESQNKPNDNPTLKPNESLSKSQPSNTIVLLKSQPQEETDYVGKEPPSIDGFRLLENQKSKALTDESYIAQVANTKVPIDRIAGWMDAFNRFLTFRGETLKQERDYRQHFPRWLIKVPGYFTMDPQDYRPVGVPAVQMAGRKVILEFNGGEVTWPEEKYLQYCNNPAASGYTFIRYEL